MQVIQAQHRLQGGYMPKKKLTKTQVKKKLTQGYGIAYDLFIDKFGQPDSNVNISKEKLMEVNNIFVNAFKRLK